MKNTKDKKGFTLVELVVILVILAILMAILVPALIGYINKSKKTACDVNINYTYKALLAEYVEQYAKGHDELTPENIEKVMTKDMEGSKQGDGYGDICPSGGIYKVEADKNHFTITCSVHGEASSPSADSQADSIMSSKTMWNYFYNDDGTAQGGRTALDSTGPNWGGTVKQEIAEQLGLDPDTFDFRVYRQSDTEYRLYISPSLNDATVGDKINVTGYIYNYDRATKTWKRSVTGNSQPVSILTGKQYSPTTKREESYKYLNAGDYSWEKI